MVVQTVFVFWLAPAIPILQISVFPPNPRLAKLSIAAVEPIDEVERQTVFDWRKPSRPPLALPQTSRLY